MTEVKVYASKEYDILIGKGLLDNSGELTKKVKKPCKALIVSDDIVYKIYGKTVESSYKKAGFEPLSFVIKNGEASKNMQTVIELLDYMTKSEITRSDLIVALGGGVVGDFAGFAASIYMRGIEFLQIPTTFLAAIDSSVGGKTGVDLKTGKNLVGSFYQPIAVICDTETLKTLPYERFCDGVSEAVKYGAIADKALFERLLTKDINENIENIIETCVKIKSDIVKKDEFDKNERQLLNFGHTAGHAIEALSNYKISHGHAVAMGMAIITKAADKLKLSKEPCYEKIIEVLNKYKIDTKCPYNASDIAKKAALDKKRVAHGITLVFLNEIGDAYLKKVPVSELEAIFELGL